MSAGNEHFGSAPTVPTRGAPLPVAATQPGAEPASGAGALEVSVGRVRREQLRQLAGSKLFLAGSAIIAFWVFCAIFGSAFAPYKATVPDLAHLNSPPSAAHWFGTDALGRDVLTRVIVGARDILEIAPLATLLGTALGTTAGLAMGYLGGVFDMVAGRVVDAALALPTVVVAFLFVVALGPSTLTLVVVIGFIFALIIARTVRAAVLQERGLDYLAAAELRDESKLHIMFVEILPNVLGPVLVEFTVRLGYSIFTIATLSFLGFGVQAPTPDWGADIASNYQYLAAGYWWETLFPALAIASLVVAVNFIGDSLETAVVQ
jgi:peptide/nickel transport system permease protein